MTRVTVQTALFAVKRVVPILFAACFATFAAGCSTSDQTAEAPSELAPTKTTKTTASVSLAPVAAPGSVSNKMGKMLASAAKAENIPLKEDEKADYTVRGYLVASPESEGTKISYIWDVTDKSGKRAHRFSGEEMVDKRVSGDPWAAVDDKSMRKIALKTADQLQQWLPKKNTPAKVATTGTVSATSTTSTPPGQQQTATSPSRSQPEVVVAVPKVTGAPGDGNTALPAAMRRQLKSRGVKLTRSSTSGAYTVRGTVELGEPEDGKQPITIKWLVLGPDGNPLKSAVVQRNKIKKGSLDGNWGQVADVAASEAAKAVAKILPDKTS